MAEIAGHKISNWWLIGGAAGGILVFYLYKHSSGASAASSATDSSGIDPVTGLPYSQDNEIDPLTGLTYLAEAQQYGSVAAAEAAYSGSAASSGYDEAGGAGGGYVGTAGYPTSNVGGTTSTPSYATNAQWAQAVTAGLVSLGYSATDIAAALGLFFAGQPLSTAADGVSYVQIVQAAEAEFGPPPQGTYSIISQPASGSGTTTTTGGTTTPPATVAVPDCAGLSAGAAHNAITAAGLHATAPTGQLATAQCTGTSPPAGTQLAPGSNVEILTAAPTGTPVPQCRGLSAGAAHNTLVAAGLKPTAPTGQKATATCTGTSPAGGTIVTPGSSVEILT